MLASKSVSMVKCNLSTSVIFVVVCFGNCHSFLIVRGHLCARKVYIRGKQHVILVLHVVYKQVYVLLLD